MTNQAAITQVTIAYTEKTENYKQAPLCCGTQPVV